MKCHVGFTTRGNRRDPCELGSVDGSLISQDVVCVAAQTALAEAPCAEESRGTSWHRMLFSGIQMASSVLGLATKELPIQEDLPIQESQGAGNAVRVPPLQCAARADPSLASSVLPSPPLFS